MPSVQDIIEFAQGLEARPVLVRDERCLAVRNRNSRCSRCVDACPVPSAIRLAPNRLGIDFEACLGCGACTAVCPTQALVPLAPTDAQLAQQVADAVAEVCRRGFAGEAVVACARAAARHQADPRTFAEVPCLCRIDASLLLGLARSGVGWTTLVDADCSTCKLGGTWAVAESVIDQANDLLDATDAHMRVERSSRFPGVCNLADEDGLRGQARREFFAHTQDGAKHAALVAATKALHLEQDNIPLVERLRSVSGSLPRLDAPRHASALKSMQALGLCQPQVEPPLWGSVHIDVDVCNACGICATFCPTGALEKQPANQAKQAGCKLLLTFDAAACTNCGACVDVCPKSCLTVAPLLQEPTLHGQGTRQLALNK